MGRKIYRAKLLKDGSYKVTIRTPEEEGHYFDWWVIVLSLLILLGIFILGV